MRKYTEEELAFLISNLVSNDAIIDKSMRIQMDLEKERNKCADINNRMKDFNMKEKDESLITWNNYFMAVAKIIALRSKDPCTKVGACIVKDNKIVSTGYNGFPKSIDNEKYPWTKDSNDETENKFFYVVHAELNAILNAKMDLSGSTLYVTKFPCNECAKAIIQSGIKKVIFTDSDDYLNKKSHYVTYNFLLDAGVVLEKYKSSGRVIKFTI